MPSTVINAPQASPSKHGLIATATDAPLILGDNRWEMGFGFVPEACAEPESWIIPCVGTGSNPGPGATRTERRGPVGADVVNVNPYVIRAPFKCDAQQATTQTGRDEYERHARRIFELGESKLVETELWRGDAAGWARSQADVAYTEPNLTLAQAAVPNVSTGGGAAPSVAIRSLIQSAAGSPGGRQCMIHATVATAMAWMQSGSIRENRDGRLVTTIGEHLVVAGTGYTGEGPGLTAPAADTHWAYLTTPVHVARNGEIEVLWDSARPATGMDRAANDIEVIVQRTAAAYWDGCAHAGLPVDITGTFI